MRFSSFSFSTYRVLLLIAAFYLGDLHGFSQYTSNDFSFSSSASVLTRPPMTDTFPEVNTEITSSTPKMGNKGVSANLKEVFLRRGRRDSSSISAGFRKLLQDSTAKDLLDNPFKELTVRRPWLKLADVYVSYQFNYRSNIDTPFAESNIQQHGIFAKSDFVVGGLVPFSVSYWGRQSNSAIFRDINDVQVNFDAAQFRAGLRAKVTERLSSLSPQIIDSLTGRLLQARLLRKAEIDAKINGSGALKQYIEAHEILLVPKVTYDSSLPDSINVLREDSIKRLARNSI